jgi:hypothetical protein
MNDLSLRETITLQASAAFQLLVAAESECVRDAAAEALWPRRFADQCCLDCSHQPFASLPFSERVLALLVASVLAKNPRSAAKLRAVPLYRFLAPPADGASNGGSRVFRVLGGRVPRVVCGPDGHSRTLTLNAAFVLPTDAIDTVIQCCSWGTVERQPYSDEYRWQVTERGIHIDLGSRMCSRALAVANSPVLLTESGNLLYEHTSNMLQLFSGGRLSADSALLLRLAAGGLSGAVIAFGNRLPIVRGHRPRNATISIEIGPSLDAPLVATHFKGDLSPRYNLAGVLPSDRVNVATLGGRTIDELHAIARCVGVWHGGRIRGSFHYHPLRTPAAPEVASHAVA